MAVDPSSLAHQDLTSQLTSAEIIAHSLQKALVPPPESPLELAAAARDAIQAIVFRLRFRSAGITRNEGYLITLRRSNCPELVMRLGGADDEYPFFGSTERVYIPVFESTPRQRFEFTKSQQHFHSFLILEDTRPHSSSHPNAPLKPGQRKMTAGWGGGCCESVVIDTPPTQQQKSNLTSNSNLSIGMGHHSTSSSEGLLSLSSFSITLDY
ncbi:hypothetical protein GYMLUDRAFT_245366 [Collybiopsis luxurians FD-317 M1]|uniref:Uncharacterized protein n=1 Tax=Collybiopsis luxurians FD-317 M1 TaxID=944289 RepID=A0A0D0CL70_9AGAR|nr:hypothetical protein GYMLUDRAFT_245366 [Collybiopsis luxurians FD-317 M1]